MFVVTDFINNHIVNNVKSEIRNKKIKIRKNYFLFFWEADHQAACLSQTSCALFFK